MQSRKVVAVIGLSFLFTGCTTQGIPSQYGHLTLTGDAAGIRAFGDYHNALVTNGKATPDLPTPAWTFREKQETGFSLLPSLTSAVQSQPRAMAQPVRTPVPVEYEDAISGS